MTEAQLIHEGWHCWQVDPYWLGTQWSYEEKQAMGQANAMKPNRISPFLIRPDEIVRGVNG